MLSLLDRVAVTGAGGRLGSALVEVLSGLRGTAVQSWRRPAYELDTPNSAPLFDRDRPSLVIHAAAWTDVDGCVRDPELAMRRNADAVVELAENAVRRESGLILVSTNEVFDGTRIDGRPYPEDATPRAANPYGASKLAGERAAEAAFEHRGSLWIVRTSWLFGPPGNDFPDKILAASDRLGDAEALPVVADEWGSPTYTYDLARAVVALIRATQGGTFHLVNAGTATRLSWAQSVLRVRRPSRAVRPVSQGSFERASRPPAWGVLGTERAAAAGVRLRHWEEALTDYLVTGH